ncbi:type IV-A pilus assembly ATPase PilB [Candidatus Magnetoovum chiemensis]|nr:type IV-A pilus assembly ATPase PilB [Candidatus Magnetoovum chiemensis]
MVITKKEDIVKNGKSQFTKEQMLEKQLLLREKFKDVANKIHSANNADEILIKLKEDILELFDCERITIYAVDQVKNELYSKVMEGAEIKKIRVPISPASLAGYAAYSLETINISDVYDTEALKSINPHLNFDRSWDEKSGFRTKQILASPISFDNRLFGVIQLINKKDTSNFTQEDEKNIHEIARILGIAFRNQSKMLNTSFNYLVSHNIITEDELRNAMAMAREQKKDIETILIEDYKVSKKDLGAALGQFYGCRFIEFNEKVIIPRELSKGLNLNYLKKNFWVPLSMLNGKATIAIDKPLDIKTTEIKSLIKADTYEFVIALKSDILKYIVSIDRGAEGDDKRLSVNEILGELDVRTEDEDERSLADSALDENASTIVRLANQIIIEAYEKGASDIHVEPNKSRKNVDIRYRIDGVCMRNLEIPLNYASALVSRIKIMANLDISEKRLPQDGKIKFLYKKRPIELRVATLPTVGGEDVVMRILAASEPMPMNALRLSKRNYEALEPLINKPYGILLVVGPTGSGKTTTLHSILGHINKPDKKIWTAEDPVEITQYGLRQVEVKPKIKFDFARAMRSFLRADPDVIMVGEMRDYETASTGIEASLTGHLVFSTLHTNSAPETITRLIDMGLDPFNFADAMLGILAQRLARTLCKDCKTPYNPSKEEFDELVKSYGESMFPELGITYSKDLKLYKAKGCSSCAHTGYRGRMGLHELLVGTDDMKKTVQQKSLMELIRKQAIKDGMRTLYQDGIAKIFQGLSDISQIRRVCLS